MKYKVLLILVLATLAYSKFLGRSKTRHPPTFTLDFQYTEEDLKDYDDFYVFCTGYEFTSFNELFETKVLINDISSGWSEEIKTKKVGSLLICLYNLQNGVKSEIPISMLISPFTYNSAYGIWHIHTEFKTYIVNNRFDDIKLDLPSEVISLKYYAWVLFHFKLKGAVGNLKISSDLTNVYNSFLYIDMIHRYYSLFVNWSSDYIRKTINELGNLLKEKQFRDYSDKSIKVAIFNNKNLEALHTIFNHNLDIDVLPIVIDNQLSLNDQLQQLEKKRTKRTKKA
jgi:hypothetical protein